MGDESGFEVAQAVLLELSYHFLDDFRYFCNWDITLNMWSLVYDTNVARTYNPISAIYYTDQA